MMILDGLFVWFCFNSITCGCLFVFVLFCFLLDLTCRCFCNTVNNYSHGNKAYVIYKKRQQYWCVLTIDCDINVMFDVTTDIFCFTRVVSSILSVHFPKEECGAFFRETFTVFVPLHAWCWRSFFNGAIQGYVVSFLYAIETGELDFWRN